MPETIYTEFIHVDELIIPDNRQRTLITDISVVDLANDIASNDLIHAPIIRADNPPTLIAGERRYMAMCQLHRKNIEFRYASETVPPFFIPVVRVSNREEIAYYEMELAENVQRLDLTWQEQSLARTKLHELRLLQSGGTQTLKATAQEISKSNESAVVNSLQAGLSDDLILTKHFNDKEIASAKTKHEAKKLLKLKLQKEHNQKLADQFQFSSVESRHEIHHGQMQEVITTIPSETVDVILTDPPYGIGAHTFGDQTLIDHEYDDSYDTWLRLMTALAHEGYRVCRQEAHAYIFCDIRMFTTLSEIMVEAGWYVWTRPLIWAKGNQGTLPRPEHGPRLTYEAILYAIKGNKKTKKVAHDVLSYPSAPKPRHAAEKPVDLFSDLLSRSVAPGDTVLDLFAGTGTILPAANRHSCLAIVGDSQRENIGIITQRLEEV